MKRLCLILLIISSLTLPGISAPIPPMEARLLSERYGYSQWENMEQLRFTVTIKKSAQTLTRRWVFDKAKNRVRLETTLADGTSLHHQLNKQTDPATWDETDRQVDQWFNSDSRWVLIPFQLNGKTVEVTSETKNKNKLGITDRISKEKFDLFISSAGLIESTKQQESLIQWNTPLRLGSFLFSTEFTAHNSDFHLAVSDLAIKLKDRDAWIYGPLQP